MAKTGVEAPGTSGSQFFVVTGEDAGLPPDYAIVGEVTDGMDTVERIESSGSATVRPPSRSSSRASPSPRADGRGRRGRPRGRRGVAVREPEAATAPPRRPRAAARVHRSTRSSSSRAPTSSRPTRRSAVVVTALTGSAGPARRFAVASRRSAKSVDGAVVVLADGPTLAPAAVERVLGEWRADGRSRRRFVRRRRAGIRSFSAARTGAGSPTKGCATGPRASCRATTSAPPATSTAGGPRAARSRPSRRARAAR